MINKWPFVTVTVVTVIFLRVSFFLFIYITIYILDIYKDYKGSIYRIFLIVTTVTVTQRSVNYLFNSERHFLMSGRCLT